MITLKKKSIHVINWIKLDLIDHCCSHNDGQENHHKTTWTLRYCPWTCLGGTKSFPIYSLSDLSVEISKRPINTASHATPMSVGLCLGHTASPINSATCLGVLAHSLRERISSLWLCRPVHFTVPLAPSNQGGQGRNYSGPQLCAESVWMKSIARGTSSERASRRPRPLQMTEEWTEHNVYCLLSC